jgi:hypothetical protein
MALQSNAVLRLLNGLLPVSSVFDLSFQFLILHLLISVCTHFNHLLFTLYSPCILYNWFICTNKLGHRNNKVNSEKTVLVHLLVQINQSSVVCSSSLLTSLGIIITKYLTYFSFTIHSINMTNPIQLTYSKNERIWSNALLYRFLQFSFTLIPPKHSS